MQSIIVIAHNLRSAHNVGSLLRTCDGLGVQRVVLTGYTAYPILEVDDRLPHIAQKVDAQIHKTALGAEKTIDWERHESVSEVVQDLISDGYKIVALEQSTDAIPLPELTINEPVALLLGNEVTGIDAKTLAMADMTTEIPMFGKKESYNVVQAAAMAIYHVRFS